MSEYLYIVMVSEASLKDPVDFYLVQLSKPWENYKNDPLECFQNNHNSVMAYPIKTLKGNLTKSNKNIVFNVTDTRKIKDSVKSIEANTVNKEGQ
ncbi:MAG: hypothetical protein EHM34_00290 [Nitrosopumilales archaeon]|nr:MAG: hypothetical protein EHM34_00290 [Nitrosopumilales archaeon]